MAHYDEIFSTSLMAHIYQFYLLTLWLTFIYFLNDVLLQSLRLHPTLHMKRRNQTESPFFVILCVLCFQRQSFLLLLSERT